jgi:uncharacterized membrane protein
MVGWIWLGGLVLGSVLGWAFARGWRTVYGLFGLGLVLGFLIVLVAYLSADTDSNGCSDCELFLGRWWEPQFVLFVVAIGYLFYLVGIGLGAFVREIVRASRRSHG